jgi:hypothetical protein
LVISSHVIHFNSEYNFFVSDAKDRYNARLVWEEITRLVITRDIDIPAEWAKYIESQKPLYQPILDDLNTAFGW